MKKINLAAPCMVGNEFEYVRQAFESNWIAPLGPFVERLEKDVCKYTGSASAVALSSGTAAIHLALLEAGVKDGDIVFCSDMTFTASANPIAYCGAHPVFIDCEQETFGMSPKALERAFDLYKPKAVIVASIYGIPAKLDELLTICKRHGVPMIEDSTEVLGSTLNGKAAGTFGNFGTYSFNGNKIITTSGGGMLVSSDKKAISHALHLATQAKEHSDYYEHRELGYNYRMSNVSAAIGVGQLERIDDLIAAKKAIHDRYAEEFKCLEQYGVRMLNPPRNCTSNYWLSILLLGDESCTKPANVVHALRRAEIEARHIWKPLHTQELWMNAGCRFITEYDVTPMPWSDYFFTHGVCLPSDVNMTGEELNRVIAVVKNEIDWSLRLNYQHGY